MKVFEVKVIEKMLVIVHLFSTRLVFGLKAL